MTERDATWQWRPVGFSKLVGLKDLALHDDGSVSAALEVGPEHLNMGGITHGGALVTLLDSAMGAAVVRTLKPGEWTATTTLTTEFMRPSNGRIEARGRVDRRGSLTAFVSGEVRNSEGDLLARAVGVWAIRSG